MPWNARGDVSPLSEERVCVLRYLLAMYEPCSWVVGGEAHDQPTAGGKKRGIATRWVVKLETSFAAIPDARALANDIVIWSEILAQFRRTSHLEAVKSIAIASRELTVTLGGVSNDYFARSRMGLT